MGDWESEALNAAVEGVDCEFWVHTCWGNYSGTPAYFPDETETEFGAFVLDKRASDAPAPERAHAIFPHVLQANITALNYEVGRTGPDDLKPLTDNNWTKPFVAGVIDVKSTVTESAGEVADRIRQVLEYVPADRLGLSTDCGLINLPRMIAAGKLRALADGAALVRPSSRADLRLVPGHPGDQPCRPPVSKWHSRAAGRAGNLPKRRLEPGSPDPPGEQMKDTTEYRRAVLPRARRALEHGAELPPDLPETIRYSWIRSRLAAAPMDRIAVPYAAVDAAGERLLRAARPVLDRFGQQLAGTHVSLVLADPEGRVVGRWAGDKSALRRLARVSIEEGYLLAEELAGTNGVGTALEVLAPVTIVGAEHYAEPLHRLVCAGVPIRHPLTRRLEGVLDLACPTADANGLLMPATLDLAAQIEREMSMGALERERVVFDAFVARSRMTSAALVALSEQYMVTNAAAADLLEPRDEACLWQQALESVRTGQPVTRPMQLSGGSTITVRCTPIMTGAHPVGALIEVTPAPARRAAGPSPRSRGRPARWPTMPSRPCSPTWNFLTTVPGAGSPICWPASGVPRWC